MRKENNLSFLGNANFRAVALLGTVGSATFLFLPNYPVDPWGLVNLKTIGKIIFILGSIEFGGYVVEKLAGHRIGHLATGFFGGLASSTAVFVSMARLSRERNRTTQSLAGACLLATSANTFLFMLIVATIAPTLMVRLGVPAGLAALASCFMGLIMGLVGERSQPSAYEHLSPLNIGRILKLSLFIFGLLAATALVKNTFGELGVEIFSFISGLFELHGLSLANATLFSTGQLGEASAVNSLYIAFAASLVSKVAISWTLGSRRFAMTITGSMIFVMALAALGGLLNFWFWT